MGPVELQTLEHAHLTDAVTLLAAACPFDDAAAVAEEKLFGSAPDGRVVHRYGAFVADKLVGLVVTSEMWIRLLAVHPQSRKRGIGTLLLAAAEAAVRQGGQSVVRTLDQPGNYLAPGIDTRNKQALRWLARFGYREVSENTNLLVSVTDNELVTTQRRDTLIRQCLARGYQIRRADSRIAGKVVKFVNCEFSTPWAYEVKQALSYSPCGVHIATRDEAIVGFAAHDGNNQGLGWFGPAGTIQSHRGNGIGSALLLSCLCDIAAAGHQQCTIAWIGPRNFYENVCGIAAERAFVVLTKDLSDD